MGTGELFRIERSARVTTAARLVLAPHAKGFLSHEIASGDNMVLAVREERRKQGTSVKLVAEALLEIRRDVPIMQTVQAEEWILNSLYHHGGPQLQFESTTCSGTILLSSLEGQALPKGRVDLRFGNPTIDRANQRVATLVLEF